MEIVKNKGGSVSNEGAENVEQGGESDRVVVLLIHVEDGLKNDVNVFPEDFTNEDNVGVEPVVNVRGEL